MAVIKKMLPLVCSLDDCDASATIVAACDPWIEETGSHRVHGAGFQVRCANGHLTLVEASAVHVVPRPGRATWRQLS